MTTIVNQAARPARLAVPFATLARRLQAAQRERAVRRLLRDMTDAQILDCGIDRSAVTGDVPVIEIERGVMDRLMNAR